MLGIPMQWDRTMAVQEARGWDFSQAQCMQWTDIIEVG